jgi:heavy metal sensor kinase
LRARIAAIPIRLRLVLAFAAVMAVVLTAVGLFVYERTDANFDARIERELAARLAAVVAIVRDDGDDLGDPVQDPLGRVDTEGDVQVLGPNGVVDATSDELRQEPLLTHEQVQGLLRGRVGHVDVDGPGGHMRVVAQRSQDDGVRYVAVVGASLADHDRTLAALERLLLVGGPVALLISSLAAYFVAAAALRPVEAMRRRAARISSDEPGRRLPLGPADDEITSLARTLNDMLARLEAAIERERRLVADAGHELRTPLAILKAEIELALEDDGDEERLRSALHSGGDEVDRLSRLADDLLVLARADDGRLPLRPERVAIARLARKVATGHAAHAGERAITTDVPASLDAEIDPLRIEQALSNLVENAIRHGDGEIVIGAARRGGRIELAVSDAGPGFPDELLEGATERFARAHGTAEGGAGLGLSIVDSIAAAHGGTVTVANNESGGAIVTISAPAVRWQTTAPEPS